MFFSEKTIKTYARGTFETSTEFTKESEGRFFAVYAVPVLKKIRSFEEYKRLYKPLRLLLRGRPHAGAASLQKPREAA